MISHSNTEIIKHLNLISVENHITNYHSVKNKYDPIFFIFGRILEFNSSNIPIKYSNDPSNFTKNLSIYHLCLVCDNQVRMQQHVLSSVNSSEQYIILLDDLNTDKFEQSILEAQTKYKSEYLYVIDMNRPLFSYCSINLLGSSDEWDNIGIGLFSYNHDLNLYYSVLTLSDNDLNFNLYSKIKHKLDDLNWINDYPLPSIYIRKYCTTYADFILRFYMINKMSILIKI